MTRRTDYDALFCGKLPLHNLNLIQPHGYLLVADTVNYQLIQVSENCSMLLGQSPEALLGRSITDWLGLAEEELRSKFGTVSDNKLPFYTEVRTAEGPRRMLALIHIRDAAMLAELFPAEEKPASFVEQFQKLKHVFAEMETTEDIIALSEVAVRHLRQLSGFDRVLMYRFDKDWNGSVIAEEHAPGMQPYLGQQFPASDIPRQARAMYQKNAYRLIPDRDYTPVRLYPVLNPLTDAFTDLSGCSIRSVAAVHLEYLKNMEVAASMSFRVMREDRLWGLVSLHHREPRFPDYETCSLFELLCGFLSNHLNSVLNRETYRRSSSMQEQKIALQQYVYEQHNLADALFNQEIKVTDLFDAEGAALLLKGRIAIHGQTPPAEFIENTGFWIQSKDLPAVYALRHFAGVSEEARPYYDTASGMLAITIDRDAGSFLLLFRPEEKTTINWGGNPEEAVRFEADRKTYHPRASFENYQEQIREHSADWQTEELKIAGELRNFLFEFLVKHP